MLKYICLVEGLAGEHLYCGGILFIRVSLPADRILAIIGMYLNGEDAGE